MKVKDLLGYAEILFIKEELQRMFERTEFIIGKNPKNKEALETKNKYRKGILDKIKKYIEMQYTDSSKVQIALE
jgi:septum formation topological specificity factor MinE